MYLYWTSNIRDEGEKENFRRSLFNSRTVLERLYGILDEKEKALDRSEINPEVYEVHNWAALQAHKNGNREIISFVKNLINLDQQKERNDLI